MSGCNTWDVGVEPITTLTPGNVMVAGRRGLWCLYFQAIGRSVTSQVLSAGLAEFNKEIEPAPVHIVQHLVHGPIRPEVGLNDRVECPLGSRDDRSG